MQADTAVHQEIGAAYATLIAYWCLFMAVPPGKNSRVLHTREEHRGRTTVRGDPPGEAAHD